jgi:hypothetical protein
MGQTHLDLSRCPSSIGRQFDSPGDRLSQGYPQDRATGFADSRQHTLGAQSHTACTMGKRESDEVSSI